MLAEASVPVKFENPEVVRDFVAMISRHEGYFDLVYGNYYANAKSILGVLALGICHILDFRVIQTEDDIQAIMEEVRPYMAA